MHSLLRSAVSGLSIMLVTVGCGATGQDTTPDPSSVTTSYIGQDASTEPIEPSPSNSDMQLSNGLTSLPSTEAQADISVFKAEITEASWGEVQSGAAHVLPGTSALHIRLKLTNTSQEATSADTLSFPLLIFANGTQASGSGDSNNPAENTFGTIDAGQSKEILLAFPAEKTEGNIQLILTDPANPDTSVTLTYTLAEG